MDRVDEYREIVKRIIREYAAFPPSATGEVEAETIIDDDQGHYELRHIGWKEWRRIHGSVLHVDIRDGKIWIQHDGTEHGIARELEALGVPRMDIVLGFHSPAKRPHTGYAVA